MSFSFNFISESNDDVGQENQELSGANESSDVYEHEHFNQSTKASFRWFQQEDMKQTFQNILHEQTDLLQNSEIIALGSRNDNETESQNRYIRRVFEDQLSSISTHHHVNDEMNTDLIPGVYEGGLKVWECSIDLCQYLCEHIADEIDVQGYVLELGCGHGLPGCYVLKRIMRRKFLTMKTTNEPQQHERPECSVVFSDYNEFVLRDVTMRNVALNALDAYTEEGVRCDKDELIDWLINYVAFGAGDWNIMSNSLLESVSSNVHTIPKDGLFDMILAAETTYTEKSTIETAQLICRHLKPISGIAYIATKRYYFGVGGGSHCFCDALRERSEQQLHKFDIQIVQVYDNGASNIREILKVTKLAKDKSQNI